MGRPGERRSSRSWRRRWGACSRSCPHRPTGCREPNGGRFARSPREPGLRQRRSSPRRTSRTPRSSATHGSTGRWPGSGAGASGSSRHRTGEQLPIAPPLGDGRLFTGLRVAPDGRGRAGAGRRVRPRRCAGDRPLGGRHPRDAVGPLAMGRDKASPRPAVRALKQRHPLTRPGRAGSGAHGTSTSFVPPAPSACRCQAEATSSSGTRSTSKTIVAGGDVADEAVVVLRELVLGDGEVGMAEDREVLEPDGAGGELGGRAGRLAEVDDRRPRGRRLHRRGDGCAPDRVEDVARAVAAERVLERRDEVVHVELRPSRPLRARSRARGPWRSGPRRRPARRRAALPPAPRPDRRRRSRRGRERSRRPVSGARQASGSQPASPAIPRPAATAGIGPVRHGDRHRVADRDLLRHGAVRRPAERAAEHPHDPAVGRPADSLAPGNVRELGMARGQDPARDGEVDRVDGRREHLDDVVPDGSATSSISGSPPTSPICAALTVRTPYASRSRRSACRSPGRRSGAA